VIAALIGFLGVVIGLVVGRGYGFWSERRSELAEAAVASATLAEELRRQRNGGASSLAQTWTEHRRWLVIHMSPRDYRALADALENVSPQGRGPLEGGNLIERIDALHSLFWDEHEAFILVPLIHYLRGETVSKRIHAILAPTRNIDELPSRGDRSTIRSWHSPSEHPSEGPDSQSAAPE